MSNYGEEYAYWYLRLNGFFPITNFVIHKSKEVTYSSDCDLLAIRTPYVYEEIGGKTEDWDSFLTNQLNFDRTIGIICEVKTGDYDIEDVFKQEYINYSLGRLGFIPHDNLEDITSSLEKNTVTDIGDKYQICKLLIANKNKGKENVIFQDFDSVINFLYNRVHKYPLEKYRDRMFFGSHLIQSIIDIAALKREIPKPPSE